MVISITFLYDKARVLQKILNIMVFRNYFNAKKVKVVPYTFVRRGVPIREDIYAEPSACEVGWPAPFPRRLYLPSVPNGYPFAAG